jgi:hypothetical protein
MYVCMHVCVYVCIRICTYRNLLVGIFYLHMLNMKRCLFSIPAICMYERMYVYLYVYVCMYICMYVYVCFICTCLTWNVTSFPYLQYVCMHVCMYVYKHAKLLSFHTWSIYVQYMHVYMHTCICVCMFV